MKHIFTLLSLFFVLNCFAQFSHTPNPAIVIAPVDTLITKYQIDITMDVDTVYEVHWQLFKDGETWNSSWGTQVCDLNLCYLENVDKNSRGIPNNIYEGTSTWYVYFIPNEIPGETEMELVLYGDADREVELYRIPIEVHSIKTTNTVNVHLKNDVTVFPNPAQDFFSLSNDIHVDKIKIYNILGSEIKTFFHYKNAQHLIGDLKEGMYLIRMIDKDNNVIKTTKLNKFSTGA